MWQNSRKAALLYAWRDFVHPGVYSDRVFSPAASNQPTQPSTPASASMSISISAPAPDISQSFASSPSSRSRKTGILAGDSIDSGGSFPAVTATASQVNKSLQLTSTRQRDQSYSGDTCYFVSSVTAPDADADADAFNSSFPGDTDPLSEAVKREIESEDRKLSEENSLSIPDAADLTCGFLPNIAQMTFTLLESGRNGILSNYLSSV